MKLRWLNRSWEEIHETTIKRKSERVLQYKDNTHELWHDVPEAYQDATGAENDPKT